MALTATERKRLQRVREKEAQAQEANIADDAFKASFPDFMADFWSDVTTYLEWVGVSDVPDYIADGDTDPNWNQETDGPYRGALGRAERMVGYYLDAASTLAGYINRYKTAEINARIAELEAADLSDAVKRKEALAEIVRLTKFRDQLNKQVRWSVPQWKLKGD